MEIKQNGNLQGRFFILYQYSTFTFNHVHVFHLVGSEAVKDVELAKSLQLVFNSMQERKEQKIYEERIRRREEEKQRLEKEREEQEKKMLEQSGATEELKDQTEEKKSEEESQNDKVQENVQ